MVETFWRFSPFHRSGLAAGEPRRAVAGGAVAGVLDILLLAGVGCNVAGLRAAEHVLEDIHRRAVCALGACELGLLGG